jgi:hypothetical protein
MANGGELENKMKPGLLIGCVVVLGLVSGCTKNESTDAVQPAPPIETAKGSSSSIPEPDHTAMLSELTQALRKFSAEKQRVPKSLQELVTAGYLPSVPAAPAGKRFEINEKRVEVVLAD